MSESRDQQRLLEPLNGADADAAMVIAAYLDRLGSPKSQLRMRSALRRLAAIATAAEDMAADQVPWWALRPEQAAAIRGRLLQRYKPAGVNVHLSALKGVLKECWRAGLMSGDAFQRATDLPCVKHRALPRGRMLTSAELAKVFSSCARDADNERPEGSRDAALLGMLVSGLRRGEAVVLEVADIDPAGVDADLVVRAGKGRVARGIYLPEGVHDALGEWLVWRGTTAGPLWTRVRRGGHVVLPPTGLSDQGVNDICRRRAERAGVAFFTPHDLRRTFISTLLDAGVDLVTVQRLAGHASVATTGRYDRRGERTKQKAVKALHVAYGRKAGAGVKHPR